QRACYTWSSLVIGFARSTARSAFGCLDRAVGDLCQGSTHAIDSEVLDKERDPFFEEGRCWFSSHNPILPKNSSAKARNSVFTGPCVPDVLPMGMPSLAAR